MIYKQNTIIYYLTNFSHSLIFTIPIWIVFYQGKISPAEISTLVSLQFLFQMIMELPSGALADLIGRKFTILLGFIAGALSSFIVLWADNFGGFLIAILLMGLSDSFRSGAEEALIFDSLKQDNEENQTEKVYANNNIIYQIGLILATASGGLIYSFNQKLPFLLYFISLLLGAGFCYLYIEPKIDSDKFTLKNYLRQIRDGSKEVFKNEYTKILSIYFIVVAGITWASTLYFNAYMMVDLGFNDDIRGYLSAIMRLLNVIIISTILKNNKLFNWKRTIWFFPIVMLLGYLPGKWLNGYFGLPFIQAAMIMGTARWIILSPLTNRAFSSKYRATAISFLSLMVGFVYILTTSISSYIIPNFGVKSMYSILGILTLLFAVPVAIKLVRKYPNGNVSNTE